MSLTAIIPTMGRASIARTILSARDQWQPGDELLIAYDTHDARPTLDWFRSVSCLVPAGVTLTIHEHDAGHHCWGHCVLSSAQQQASGDWLCWNDDDDVFTPTAFAAIRRATAEITAPMPLLFRFVTHYGLVAWADQTLQQGTVGGHCLVVPNVRERLGTWTCRYEGDYDFVIDTLTRWRAAGVPHLGWCRDVIAVARPEGGTK